MSAERVYVVAMINGTEQRYQRDTEQRRDGRWIATPYFVINRREAVTMSQEQGRALVEKIRGLGFRGELWLETTRGRRIDLVQPAQESSEDHRQPVIATLDGVNWYAVKPIIRPAEGRQWFISIPVPGFPVPVVLYAPEPLEVLQRASDLNYLQFATRYETPAPQQQQQQQTAAQSRGYRRRPGGN